MARPIVEPEIYSREYFLTDNEGWREYADGLDSHIHPKFAKAIELASPSAGDSVLDIGCGRGELLFYCAMRGAKAFGLDYSPAAVEIARQTINTLPKALQGNASADVGDPSSYHFNGSFTIVFMIDTVEHMYDWQLKDLFYNMDHILSDEGRLVIITPNHLYEKYLSPVKRLLNLPLNLFKLPLRLFKGRYRGVGARTLLHKAFRIWQDRGEVNRSMHVNVMTPAKMRKLLKAFDSRIFCEDSSKNIISLISKRWLGRNIVAIARKR